MSPSGKAADSESAIGGSNPSIPTNIYSTLDSKGELSFAEKRSFSDLLSLVSDPQGNESLHPNQ